MNAVKSNMDLEEELNKYKVKNKELEQDLIFYQNLERYKE